MYKNYEDKLNTILSNAKGEKLEKIEFNTLKEIEVKTKQFQAFLRRNKAILREAQKDTNSNDLFSNTKITFDPYEKYQNIKEISQNKALEFEKEAFGFYFTGHPIQINENFW